MRGFDVRTIQNHSTLEIIAKVFLEGGQQTRFEPTESCAVKKIGKPCGENRTY
jgi:hypothetical protein